MLFIQVCAFLRSMLFWSTQQRLFRQMLLAAKVTSTTCSSAPFWHSLLSQSQLAPMRREPAHSAVLSLSL